MFTEGIVTEEQIRNMLIDHKLKKEEISKKILTLKMTEVSEESMKELGNSILSQLFNDLASKNLSNGLYESLLVEADITATTLSSYSLVARTQLPLRVSTSLWQ